MCVCAVCTKAKLREYDVKFETEIVKKKEKHENLSSKIRMRKSLNLRNVEKRKKIDT